MPAPVTGGLHEDTSAQVQEAEVRGRKVADVIEDAVHIRRRHAEPLRQCRRVLIHRRCRNNGAARVGVVRTVQYQRRELAEDLSAEKGSAVLDPGRDDEVMTAPRVVRAAAGCLFSVNKAINGSPEADTLVALATSHLNAEISRFVVPESLRGLGLDDRLTGLTIVGALNIFLTGSERPSPIRSRVRQLETQRSTLMKLHTYLQPFDPDLARVFARDSETSPTDAIEPPVAAPRPLG